MAPPADEDCYLLEISSSPDFSSGNTISVGPLPYNFYTPDEAFAPGTYYWRYTLWPGNREADASGDADSVKSGLGAVRKLRAEERDAVLSRLETEWSVVRRFTVPDGLPETPLPARESRFAKARTEHPRLWLNPDEIAALRERIRTDPDACGWSAFMRDSVEPWLKRDLIPEPQRYPGNRRVAKLWRQMYIDCQEVLYAVRHLSVAGVVLQDRGLIEQAKRWLLHAAGWDTEGTTSRDYNDEAAFRIAGALAWGYDWLYHELSEEERRAVRAKLLRRTEQVADHVIARSKIHHVPYDSHAVRSLSSVLAPCCIALLHEEEQAREWLDYTLEYYACLYSPWGGPDGGWAEGPMYWTTGMAYVTEALNLLRKYLGIDFYNRPFFQKTGDFPLYCFSPDTVRASFGDQSILGDPPSLKTGYLMRQFAGVTGSGLYQWYFEQVNRRETIEQANTKFYNYGWWDFRFDEMMYLHDYPQVEPEVPTRIEPVKWFRDIGWVAMHAAMDDPDEHIMLLTKSSPYGSISHSHGDQNAFLLHAYGEPLAMESGYYVAFNSTMHLNWRRQTRSTNNLLIDGQGQYAGLDKSLNLQAAGRVEEASFRGGIGYVRMDATEAYRVNIPYVKRCVREIYFVHSTYVVIVDAVDLEQPGQISWLMHTWNKMRLGRQRFRAAGEKAEMLGEFVYCSSGDLTLTQHDQFTDVDPEEFAGLPAQWHLEARTPKALGHRIVTLLVPMKKGEERFVSHFVDDQDHGVHIYFTDQGRTTRISVDKAY
jgi:hypothetical protein